MVNYTSVFNHSIPYFSVLPYLYRYENQEFIDRFFETGELLISSFSNYQKYEDNQLGDRSEGIVMALAKDVESDFVGIHGLIVGSNEYVFCTSTLLDFSFLEKFSRNSVFRIKDPLSFVLELTRSVPRVLQVFHGNCLYLNARIIEKNIKGLEIESTIENQMELSNNILGFNSLFVKQRQYQAQSEYRVLWQTDREVKGSIIIKCPEAIKFCERIKLEDI